MKKVVLIILGLLLLCCCCSVIAFGLVGHVELNGQCAYKGPLSNETSGLCKKDSSTTNTTLIPSINTTKYDGRNADQYTFYYPKDFILDDSGSIVYIYSVDPKKNTAGNFNDNLNIVVAGTAFDVNKSNCTDYTNSVLQSVGSTLNVDESSIVTKIDNINGLDVCLLTWNASLSGTEFTQHQYVFTDKINDTNYILTVSLKKNSANESLFNDVVNSFESK